MEATYVLIFLSIQVQLQLFSVFATDLATGTGCAAHLRRDVGVSRLMYMLKTFYRLSSENEFEKGKGTLRVLFCRHVVVL